MEGGLAASRNVSTVQDSRKLGLFAYHHHSIHAQTHCCLQDFVRKPGPFAYYHDAAVAPIVSAAYPRSATQRWRKGMRDFTGAESAKMLPAWVDEIVMRGRCNVPQAAQKKKGFQIAPAEGARFGVPAHTLQEERLTAPVRAVLPVTRHCGPCAAVLGPCRSGAHVARGAPHGVGKRRRLACDARSCVDFLCMDRVGSGSPRHDARLCHHTVPSCVLHGKVVQFALI
jgi:hypothetical protein